jgi:hypothetical protein
MVVVVLESGMLESTKWTGKIGNVLQQHYFVDMSFDFTDNPSKGFMEKIDELAALIRNCS